MTSYDFGTRRLVSQEDASLIANPAIPRTRISGSWSHLTTFDAGYLIPFCVDEVMPGDHMQYHITPYVRMSTPLFPIFSSQRVDIFGFFVPNRLTWPNFLKLMGEQDEPDDSIAYTVPYIESPATGHTIGSVYDHMELPTDQQQVTQAYRHSALPLRAYYRIWNAWFRDQNVQNSVLQSTDDGPDLYTEYGLLVRAKSHDYFTSALPWPQKFQAATVPLLGMAPVSGIGTTASGASAALPNVRETGGNITSYPFYHNLYDVGSLNHMEMSAATSAFPMVYADLSSATGVDVNQLRTAFLVQALTERDARGGTRYIELVREQFGVRSSDARLQRPEYIGGGQTPLSITPIAQTAPNIEDGSVVGALGATGTAVGSARGSYAAEEHGYIIWLINVRTELAYQQGLQRHWSRSTRYDFPFPALTGLGEQAILRKEIYCTGNPVNDLQVFGYQERYHEMRTRQSWVTGKFRSDITGTLDMWHLAQYFGSAPTLSDTFLQDAPPMERVLSAGASAVGMQYLADIFISRTMARPLSTYGTPATLGRF